MTRVRIAGAVAAALVAMSPFVDNSQASEPVFLDFDTNNFDDPTSIDNKLLPLKPGAKLVLEGTATDVDGDEEARRMELYTTGLTKEIGGIKTVVVYIKDYADDELVEAEIAFYAQDNDDNVWYFGEYSEEYEGGEFAVAKSWIHGFEEAKVGLAMKANPLTGEDSYFQGWGPAVDWTDFAKVMEVGQENCVPVGCYKDVVIIDESSLGEEGAFQVKYYAPGIGKFRVAWKGDDASKEQLELVESADLDFNALAELNATVLELEKHAYEISDLYKQTSAAE